nr:unnamed protein product [Haemonchus contortus]
MAVHSSRQVFHMSEEFGSNCFVLQLRFFYACERVYSVPAYVSDFLVWHSLHRDALALTAERSLRRILAGNCSANVEPDLKCVFLRSLFTISCCCYGFKSAGICKERHLQGSLLKLAQDATGQSNENTSGKIIIRFLP